MRQHIDKHLVGALCVCLVITASFAFSAFMFNQPTPPAQAAVKTMIAQPVADGTYTGWTGYPKPSWGYVDIDETTTCNSSDYNFTTATASAEFSSTGTESYVTRLSTIPNTTIKPANDGTGNQIKTSYRITKIEVVPCLALHLPAPKTSYVVTFYRFKEQATSADIKTASSPTPYTLTSNLFKQMPATAWTTNMDKYADSVLEVGVRYTKGNGGARVSQMKVKVTYDTVVETIPAVQPITVKTYPTITSQPLSSATLANADQDLAKFQISTDIAGTSYVKQLVFQITRSNGMSLSSVRIRKGAADMALTDYAATYVDGSYNAIDAKNQLIEGSASGTGYLVISFTNEESIAGNSGNVYTLHANVSGASTGKSITTNIYQKTPAELTKGSLLKNASLGVLPANANIYTIDANTDGLPDAFGDVLWSDGSAIPHSSTDGASGSNDWFNGVNLSNLSWTQTVSL